MGESMRNTSPGRGAIWAVAMVIVGIVVLAVAVSVHNVFGAYVGLAVTLAPLMALFLRR